MTRLVNESIILTKSVNAIVGRGLSGKINKTQDIYNGRYEAEHLAYCGYAQVCKEWLQENSYR
ncbi:hypothetical protein [Clostridium sp. OS1-26]|uniref:hypothetical protein n=1 Tax=Clostridium sp. OS1-26 TaxID=3070681 RepID=UPI0027E1959F|nr:hypothetical protein [Clostridium sp. OS1-26]WML34347.1 hypothetical protein RCG18_24145 [Clostridium sp. OS1-26]